MTTPNAGKGAKKSEHSCIADENVKWWSPQESLAVSYKTRYTVTVWSSNCTPGHFSRRSDIYVHINTYAQTLMATLFVIARNRRQFAVHPWVHTNCGVYKPCDTAQQQRGKQLPIRTTQNNLKGILLSERANPESTHTLWFHLCNNLEVKLWKWELD